MSCFAMTALSLSGQWTPFEIEDVPVTFTEDEFALLKRPGSPRLLLKTIRRGERETGLYEGDIIEADGDRWLVCYERGFYAINTDYVIKYLNQFDSFKLLGTLHDTSFPIPMTERAKHLFRYKDYIFRINDIIGVYLDGMILRCVSKQIPFDEIHQECCITYNKERVYLDDVFDKGKVCLYHGRVAFEKDGTYTDLATGGIL